MIWISFCCFFLPTISLAKDTTTRQSAITSSSSLSSSSIPNHSVTTNLQSIVWNLQEEWGIIGLCHPTSNDFAPFFPHCNHYYQNDTSRRMNEKQEQQEEQEQQEQQEEQQQSRRIRRRRHLYEEYDTDTTKSNKDQITILIFNSCMVLLCISLAALAAGLTLGLLSINSMDLLVKMRIGTTEVERRQAASLLPIVRKRHQLLVTLLILNSIANEALPLFLDQLVPSVMAILLSVTLVLFFGEIIPSAIFTGSNKIALASKLAPLVRFLMCILYPIAIPIARMLDFLLDHQNGEETAFTRAELSAMIRIQYEERLAFKKQKKKDDLNASTATIYSLDNCCYITTARLAVQGSQDNDDGPMCHYSSMDTNEQKEQTNDKDKRSYVRQTSLHIDEVNIMEGALNLKTKQAIDIYTPIRNIFSIPADTILTEESIIEIYSSGYSRVPVFQPSPREKDDKSAYIGVLLTKQLMVVNSHEMRQVTTLPLLLPHAVPPTINLVDLINLFQDSSTRVGKRGRDGEDVVVGSGHLAIVCARPEIAKQALAIGDPIPPDAAVMGIVTLEDCVEELLQEQIYDETDRMELYRVKSALHSVQIWKKFVQRKKKERHERRDTMDTLQPNDSMVTDDSNFIPPNASCC